MSEEKKTESSLSEKADAAFRQAARDVIQRAKQTGTPVVIWKNGKVTEVAPEEIDLDSETGNGQERKKS